MADFSCWDPFPIEFRDADLRKCGEGRPEGLHLGTVVQHMALLAKQGWDSKNDEYPLCMQEGFIWETAVSYMATGMMLEDALQLSFKRYLCDLNKDVITQIMLERDGIHMTPDGLDPDKGELHSYKHTRRSFKNARDGDTFQREFWTWMVAEKGYCLAAGVDTTRFIVLWAAGDYSRGYGTPAQALQCTLKWTPEELIQNWKNVLTHARGFRK